jgi:phosphate transport system permease protein
VSKRNIKKTIFQILLHIKEQPTELVLFLCASFSIVILFLMLFFVASEGALAFSNFGLELLIGQVWDTNAGLYGAFPLIFSSVMVSIGALAIAIPLGLGTSIFITEVVPFSIRDLIKSIIELLASIPSVIYGFIGIIFLVPAIASVFGISSGYTALAASLVVAIMAVPTIVGVSGETLSAVPKDYKEASLALGATKLQTLRHVILPIAKSGILASIMLGFGRAVGETVAVLMVVGNRAQVPVPPWNFLEPVYPITSVIAMQMGEASLYSEEYSALFGLGLILFIFTFMVNTIADVVVRREGKMGGRKK